MSLWSISWGCRQIFFYHNSSLLPESLLLIVNLMFEPAIASYAFPFSNLLILSSSDIPSLLSYRPSPMSVLEVGESSSLFEPSRRSCFIEKVSDKVFICSLCLRSAEFSNSSKILCASGYPIHFPRRLIIEGFPLLGEKLNSAAYVVCIGLSSKDFFVLLD